VADQNPDLLFSGGEPAPYGDEDHLMHPAMVRPLADLAEAVTNPVWIRTSGR
jgi:hypothetical protein